MTGNIIKGKTNEPIAVESTLGWIISGPLVLSIVQMFTILIVIFYLFLQVILDIMFLKMKLIINCQRFGI